MPLFSLDGQLPDMAPANLCYVAPTAVIIGKVRLKAGASVWFGAVLRGDNEWIEVGERSNVQDNCTLHTDPGYPLMIGAGCTIGHNAILHGCSIASHTLIGMGAIVMNGAQIGTNCIVGAGTLIGEHKTVPDNALVVGAPMRKLRDIDAEAATFIRDSADVYFKRWQDYAKNLKAVP